MPDLLVITPVKDSIETTMQTIESIYNAEGNHTHVVFNDFSSAESKEILEKNQLIYGYELVNLEDITQTPSPNYRLVLQMAQKRALIMNIPLVIIESDVIIKEDTLTSLLEFSKQNAKCGLFGSITTDESGEVNFPYLNFKKDIELNKNSEILDTNHSLSFCCTLLSKDLLSAFSFQELSKKKDWYDVHISKKSKKLGFNNYLATNIPVIHKPHSSRPWKQLKYTNPINIT